MKPGEKFEIKCTNYLKRKYSCMDVDFKHYETADSTNSDIEVIINNKSAFFIEAKEPTAQSGQFVLLPNKELKQFIFSPRNKSVQNEMTDIIINYMNSHFDIFNNAGTKGEDLNIDEKIIESWIIDHYRKKNVSYVITERRNIVIFPLSKFSTYFDVKARYRIKKSGSKEPAMKNYEIIKKEVMSKYNVEDVIQIKIDNKNRMYAVSPIDISKNTFSVNNDTYYLQEKSNYGYEIRRLSKTYNMNVIFSITLTKDQEPEDLMLFEKELKEKNI